MSETSLSRHMENLHGKSSEGKRIVCDKCEQSFTLASNLQPHMREKHTKRSINLDIVENLDQVIEFECELCKSMFKREANIK